MSDSSSGSGRKLTIRLTIYIVAGELIMVEMMMLATLLMLLLLHFGRSVLPAQLLLLIGRRHCLALHNDGVMLLLAALASTVVDLTS